MKYKKFLIRNYKAIEELTINLNRNVIPLIGVNESGKTSILQAILAFDKDKDNLLGGLHSNPKNKYKTIQSPCELQAYLEIEDEDEFRSIGEEIRLKMDNPLYSWLKSALDNKREISIKRNYENGFFQKSYSLISEKEEILTNSKTSALVNAIVKRYSTNTIMHSPSEIHNSIRYVSYKTKKITAAKTSFHRHYRTGSTGRTRVVPGVI